MKKNIYPVAVALLFGLTIGILIGYKFSNKVDNDQSNSNWSEYITLGDYKGLTGVKQIQIVTDEDIEEAIAVELTTEEEITDRGIKKGDIVNIDFVGTIDGIAFDNGSYEDYGGLVVGDYDLLEDLEDGLIGAKVGDELKIPVTFPEDYDDSSVAGKNAEFAVTINEIAVEKVAELTEDYAKNTLGFDSIAEFRMAVIESLEEDNRASAEDDLKNTLFSEVLDASSLNTYTDEMYAKFQKIIDTEIEDGAAQWGIEDSVYKQDFMGLTDDTAYKEYVEIRILEDLLFEAIADKEDLNLSNDEYEESALEMAQEYGYDTVADFEADNSKEEIKSVLLRERVLDFIVSNATVTEEIVAKEE